MTARHEIDRMSRESWSDLGHEFKATSNSMGRVGLSFARRHPALLLGGGALLGLGAVMFLTRGKKDKRDNPGDATSDDGKRQHVEASAERPQGSKSHDSERPKRSKTAHFAGSALVKILKSGTRMWLLEHLSGQLHPEPQDKSDSSAFEARTESAA